MSDQRRPSNNEQVSLSEGPNDMADYRIKLREILQREATRLRHEQESIDSMSTVNLNVGGHCFQTSVQTLTKYPNTMLAAMFSGQFERKLCEDGAFVIDRDGTHFRFILNYLRTGKLNLPEGATFLKELLEEAEFYQIQGIIDELRASVQAGSTCKQTTCSSPWKLALHNDANGNVLSGSKDSLMAAVLSGARVRVIIGTSYSTEADNVKVSGNHVFAQLLQHVSKASWDRFKDDAYWWWVLVSTNGVMQMTRYSVGSNYHRGTTSDKTSIEWYIQTNTFIPKPTYSHLASGNKVQGSLTELESSVQNGNDIRCVRGKSYSFPLQNVAINSKGVNFVTGQTLDHISTTSSSNNLLQFQSNAYWWFTIVTTCGLRDMSSWTVGLHQSRGHTQDTVAIEWFADECWKEVFFHDGNGQQISGSRYMLTSSLMSGHRVRFQIPEWNYYTAEVDNLSVRNGHVTAQALKHVSKSLTKFQHDAYWYWLMVSTTGTLRATRYNVGEHKHRGDSTDQVKVKWFIDIRPWEQVLSSDKSGNILEGCRHALVQAVRAGADVRCVQGDEVQGYAYKAQNLAVSPDGNHVAAQSVNSVSMQSAPNQNEMKIQPNAYWWFTIVSTTGLRDMSRWTVGEHIDRGHTSDQVGQKWFVNR